MLILAIRPQQNSPSLDHRELQHKDWAPGGAVQVRRCGTKACALWHAQHNKNLTHARRVIVQITDQLFQLILTTLQKNTRKQKQMNKKTSITNSTLQVGKELEGFLYTNIQWLNDSNLKFSGPKRNVPIAVSCCFFSLPSLLDPNKNPDQEKGQVFPFLFHRAGNGSSKGLFSLTVNSSDFQCTFDYITTASLNCLIVSCYVTLLLPHQRGRAGWYYNPQLYNKEKLRSREVILEEFIQEELMSLGWHKNDLSNSFPHHRTRGSLRGMVQGSMKGRRTGLDIH